MTHKLMASYNYEMIQIKRDGKWLNTHIIPLVISIIQKNIANTVIPEELSNENKHGTRPKKRVH